MLGSSAEIASLISTPPSRDFVEEIEDRRHETGGNA